jgi:hypothetical protein
MMPPVPHARIRRPRTKTAAHSNLGGRTVVVPRSARDGLPLLVATQRVGQPLNDGGTSVSTDEPSDIFADRVVPQFGHLVADRRAAHVSRP